MFGTIPGWTDEDGRQYVTTLVTARKDGDPPLRRIGSLNADDIGSAVEVYDHRPEIEGRSHIPAKRRGTILTITHVGAYRTLIKLVGGEQELICSSTSVVRFLPEDALRNVYPCKGCGQVVARATLFGNTLISIDPEPVPDPDPEGDLAMLGDTPIDEVPTVMYGEKRPGLRWRRHPMH